MAHHPYVGDIRIVNERCKSRITEDVFFEFLQQFICHFTAFTVFFADERTRIFKKSFFCDPAFFG